MASGDPALVHPVAAEEIRGWARSMAATFLSDPDGPGIDRRIGALTEVWDPERAWGVRDRGRWVATLRTEPRSLTLPGGAGETGDVIVDALTNVTVAPTHRRRGLLSRMMTESLRAAHARGDALSILIAAEWPIYGRFGYAPATLSSAYTLRRSRPGAALAGDVGRVRQVERDEFGAVAPAVFTAARRRWAGQVDRSALWWSRVLGRDGHAPLDGLPHNWLVHEGDDGPDGLLAWRAVEHAGLLPPLATAEVWNLTSAGDDAYRDLWAYLSGIDGVDEVRLTDRPVEEPVRWMLGDGRALVATEQVDLLWLRLLDVPAALQARGYPADGEVVLEVLDGDGAGFAAGRYRLRVRGGAVECGSSGDPADVEITQRALAAIYLGGFRVRELAAAGAARERSAGALAALDVMFHTPLPPWNPTWF